MQLVAHTANTLLMEAPLIKSDYWLVGLVVQFTVGRLDLLRSCHDLRPWFGARPTSLRIQSAELNAQRLGSPDLAI